MPPRKKNRQSARLESTPSGDAVEDPPRQPDSSNFDDELAATTTDAWTDEQEITLFKGIIKWKPVGMHKHFRMIAISQYLQSHSHTLPENSHTSTARIWDKLRTLYNMEALDERENSYNESMLANGDPAKTDSFHEFELQGDELADMMFAKRLASEASPSPASLRNQGTDDLPNMQRQSTIEDTDDPRSSPASVRETRSGRGPKTTRSTRKSHLKEMTKVQNERRSSKTSIDETNEDDQEDDEEAEDGEAAGKQGDNSPADSPVASKNKSTRTKRRRGGRRN